MGGLRTAYESRSAQVEEPGADLGAGFLDVVVLGDGARYIEAI